MKKQESKRIFAVLKDHIAEYYGKGLAERYEINSIPETGWDDATHKGGSKQSINLDFTFDFFLLFQKKKLLGLRVLAHFHLIYSELRSICLKVLQEQTSNVSKVILAKSHANQYKNVKVLLKIVNFPCPASPLCLKSTTALRDGVLIPLRHLVITAVHSSQEVSFLETWNRECSCALQPPTTYVRRDNLLEFVRLYPDYVQIPQCKKCKKSLKLSHTQAYKMSFQICEANLQNSLPCLPQSVTLFFFEPFINRLKVGNLIDATGFVIPIKKSTKAQKYALKVLRVVVFNFSPSTMVSHQMLQVFNSLGIVDNSCSNQTYFRKAPVVLRLQNNVRNQPSSTSQAQTCWTSDASASTTEENQPPAERVIYENDIHNFVRDSAREFIQLCHILPNKQVPGFLGLQLSIPIAILHHQYMLQTKDIESEGKPFHHLIVSFESYIWRHILKSYAEKHNFIILNSSDISYYSTPANLLTLEGKIVIVTVFPFLSCSNKKELQNFLTQLESMSSEHHLTITCFVLQQVDIFNNSKKAYQLGESLQSFFSFEFDFTSQYKKDYNLAFSHSLLKPVSSSGQQNEPRTVCKFKPPSSLNQKSLSLCEIMVYYAKKNPEIPFRQIEELGRFTRAVARLRCSLELVTNSD